MVTDLCSQKDSVCTRSQDPRLGLGSGCSALTNLTQGSRDEEKNCESPRLSKLEAGHKMRRKALLRDSQDKLSAE
jgi:hypothetical protein